MAKLQLRLSQDSTQSMDSERLNLRSIELGMVIYVGKSKIKMNLGEFSIDNPNAYIGSNALKRTFGCYSLSLFINFEHLQAYLGGLKLALVSLGWFGVNKCD